MDGRVLRAWIIFKGVIKQKAWIDAFPEAISAYILSTSE